MIALLSYMHMNKEPYNACLDNGGFVKCQSVRGYTVCVRTYVCVRACVRVGVHFSVGVGWGRA